MRPIGQVAVDEAWLALRFRPSSRAAPFSAAGSGLGQWDSAVAIAYLASPHAGLTTGTALTIDGGMAGLRLPSY